jgi:pimeloyl-ACP methyl ester carboxylesterase
MSPTQAATPFEIAYDQVLAQWPVTVTQADVPSRFGTTHVNVCGSTGNPPLVLLCGGGATSTVWFRNVAALGQLCRVYAIDPIYDSGRSVYDGDPVKTVDDLVEWLDSTLDGLGIEQADMCGHSYHGWVSAQYAITRPSRVRRLALLEPTACVSAQSFRFMLRAVPLFVRPKPATSRNLITWEASGRPFDPAFYELWGTGYPGRTTLVWPKRLREGMLRRLRTPTLVLLAENTRTHNVHQAAANVKRLWPGARVVTLSDASHFTVPMHPADAINEALVAFLTATTAAPACGEHRPGA